MNDKIIKPRIVAFELTQRCPLSCRHCRAAAVSEGVDGLSTEQCVRILRGLAAYNKCVVILTGGEPMCRDDVYEIIAAGRGVGLRMAMASCGYYIDDATAVQLKDAGVMSVSFSLDGPDAASHDAFRQTPGAFETTCRAIESVKKAGLRFQINTTLTSLNHDKVDPISALAVALGATCWNPFVLVPVGRGDAIRDLIISDETYETLLVHLARLKQSLPIELRLTCGPQFARVARQEKIDHAEMVTGCLAGTGFAFISSKGHVQTCGFLEKSAGHLIEAEYDFGQIWEHSAYLNELRDHSKYKGACGQCGYLRVCRGCRARAYTMTGDYLGEDPICKVARGLAERADR